jgi:hypothetical protein
MAASPHMPARPRPTTRILRAAVAAIRPRGHGFDQPVDADVLAEIEQFFPFLPTPLRLGFPIGLRLLEWGPPLVIRRFARFSNLALPDAQRYLTRVHHLGGPATALMLGLRTLVFLAFYQHPTVLADMGVDWAGRARQLVTRRAELLAANGTRHGAP